MLRKLQYALLVGSIGLIGADRIDLFAGQGPFVLTPFLVLAPSVILLHLVRRGVHGRLSFSITPPIHRQIPFAAASSLFLLFSFASIPLSLDPERSMVAFCDLLLVAVLGYCISLQILLEPAQEQLTVRSVGFSVVVYIVFCIGECVAWTHGITMTPGAGPVLG